METPQIIAMGGGGFSKERDNTALDRYILTQTGKVSPRIIFLPTASGDSDEYIVRFYTAFNRLSCRPSHLKLFHRTPDLRELLLEQDVIYVGGGNTKSMLATWREWGLPEILREAWQAGVVMAGLSAGAICWFEQGLTDSWAGELCALDCLGFLEGSCCPHFDSEPERQPVYCEMIAAGKLRPGYALDDFAAVHYCGRELQRVIISHPQARAYYVGRAANDGTPEVLSAGQIY